MLLNYIKKRVKTEFLHYSLLGKNLQIFLLSTTLFNIVWILILIFINAYLWQKGKSAINLTIYNLGLFIGLSIGAYLNKFLLIKIHILKLIWLGAMLQGISGFIITYFSTNNLINLGTYGLILGTGTGIYYANKNWLTLRLTKGSDRMYYNNIEYILGLLIKIIVPATAGWFLVVGEKTGLYSKEVAYQILFFAGIILIFINGLSMQSLKVTNLKPKNSWLRKNHKDWNLVRLYNLGSNVFLGLSFFLPSILILTLLGAEETLGIVQSASSALSALAAYIIGRKIKVEKSWILILMGSLLISFSSIFLAWNYTWIAVLFFIFFTTVGKAISVSSYSVNMEMMDRDYNLDKSQNQYAYICDNELFFNIGRVLGIILYVSMILIGGSDFGLRYVLLIASLIQLFSTWTQKKLNDILSN